LPHIPFPRKRSKSDRVSFKPDFGDRIYKGLIFGRPDAGNDELGLALRL
jgi:hypothetical protein